ncbi:MAG: hypothetical protein V3U27_09420 [Candidatus Tectomicrobia bacterium]
MLTPQERLARLEQTALSGLHDVDLETPMQQISHVLDALLDIPTAVRGVNTPFSNQALGGLQTLVDKAYRLCAAVDTLTEHISRAPSTCPRSVVTPCAPLALAD